MRVDETKLARLIDKMEIEEVILRYTRGLDRRDWDAVRSVYHPDAIDEHGDYRGGPENFVLGLIERHKTVEQSMHFVTNLAVEMAGSDDALVETYFITLQRVLPTPGTPLPPYAYRTAVGDGSAVQVMVAGRYIDHMTRYQGEWRILHRQVAFEVRQADAAQPGGMIKPEWIQAGRSGDDPIDAWRKKLGLAS